METITKIYPLVNPVISNILIVDDVPANLQILCSILEREGYKVRPVTSGKLALQVVEKMKPDLILLDIMMQGMDGFEVCRKLKENPDLAEIPVVFISALNDTSDIVKALNSGGVDYITKPFHAEEVIARVKTHLQLYLQKKELHEQRVVLQRLNSEKDMFLSIVAHDLRSPFNGFLGLTQILASDLADLSREEIKPIALALNNSANKVFKLLEDILEWVKMGKGSIPFDPQPEQMSSIIDACLFVVLDHARNKQIEISVDIPDGLLVIGDRNMLQAVIRNLLSNAIKFTPKGGKISLKATTSVNKMVEISIQDSGIGMSSLLMDGIFSLDRNTSRKGTAGEYGSGFGLIIVKEFIEKQGSELFVESVEGEGTIFRFSLPSEIK